MKIGVAASIFTQKNIEGSMVKLYLYPTRREQNIVAIIEVYVARVTILVSCDNQDTES